MVDQSPLTSHIRPSQVIFVLAGLAGVYYLAIQFGNVDRILGILWQSSWFWVSMAIVSTTAALYCAAWVQYLAGDKLGRPSELFVLILAGGLFDHFLPFSIGGIGLTAAYYRRLGQANPRAVIMATSPVVVGALVAQGVLLVVSPGTVGQIFHTLGGRITSPLVTYGAAGVMSVGTALIILFRRRIYRRFVESITALKGLHGRRQVLAVAGWSLVRSLLAASALYMSVVAVHGDVSFFAVIIIFLVSLFISEAMPTPGGIGATEAVLVVGLSGAGLDTAHAIAATLMYRLVTFILPMLPGVAVIVRAKRLVEMSSRQ